MDKSLIEKIIIAGTYAPSGDNSQPWRFEVEGNNISLFKQPKPQLDHPRFNFKERGTYLALGAVLENMRIAALSQGFQANLTYGTSDNPDEPVAIMKLQQSHDASNTLSPFVAARCTNRKLYSNKVLTTQQKNTIESVEKEKSVMVSYIYDEKKIKKIANILSIADRVALEDHEIHDTFFSHLTWTKREEEDKHSGLYLETTELPKFIKFIFRFIKHWKIQQIVNALGFSRIAGFANAKTYEASACIALFSVSQLNREDMLDAGMAMENLWIKATSCGLAAHPVTGLLYLGMRIAETNESGLNKRHEEIIRNAYDILKEETGIKNETPVMLLRIGVSADPTARCTRLPPVVRYLQ